MQIVGQLEWINGFLRYGHMECNVPKEDEEKVKTMSNDELTEYLEINGEVIIDSYRIEDMDTPTGVEIIEDELDR